MAKFKKKHLRKLSKRLGRDIAAGIAVALIAKFTKYAAKHLGKTEPVRNLRNRVQQAVS